MEFINSCLTWYLGVLQGVPGMPDKWRPSLSQTGVDYLRLQDHKPITKNDIFIFKAN